MNKQFLSVLLLTSFVSSASAALVPVAENALRVWAPNFVLVGGSKLAAFVDKLNPFAVVAATRVATVGAAVGVTEVLTHSTVAAAQEAAKVAAEQAAKVAAEQLRVAKQLGFYSVDVMHEYFVKSSMNQSMMAELDKVNAKLWAQTPVLDKAKYYAGAAWDGTVSGAKSAYNATANGVTVAAEWAQNHPGYAVAAVAGIATAGYLGYRAYNYFTTPSESISAQDQQIDAGTKINLEQLCNQTPGAGFFKDGYNFDDLEHRKFFTADPAYYGLSKENLWYLNDLVTCCHALNYINKFNLKVNIDAIVARLKTAKRKISAVTAA